MNLYLSIFISFLFFTKLDAQPDTTVLSYQAYLANIVKYHPLVKQANLKIDLGNIELLAAKGLLDPKLTANWQEKDFEDKLYYRLFQSKLKIPTRLGIDVVGGYENTEGVFLNPENKTAKRGLWHIGIEANLLQGLIVNERRTTLAQAKIFQNIAKNQQQILLNDLLYNASLAYLDWQKYTEIDSILQENITIATNYLENTKQSFISGEKTSMDTLEAFILLQDATVIIQTNKNFLTKSKQQLENFLWFQNLPLVLQTTTRPENITNEFFQINIEENVANLVNRHPEILEKRSKQSSYEIGQQLKKEKLKPKLKVKFNPLLATSDNSIAPTYSASDYKWGFDFSFPLFLRKERAGIQAGEIKIKEAALDIENKQVALQNKIEGSLQLQTTLTEQIRLQQQNVIGYQQLLAGENEKFTYGESSIFLLNKRQEKYINGQLKLIQLSFKLQLERLNYLYYTNGLLV